MKNNYKIVFLDWHKTLCNDNFWHQLENPKHPRHSNLGLISNELFTGDLASLIDPWMRGEHTTEEIIKLVSKKTKLSFDEVLEDLTTSCKSMQFIHPEIPKLVKKFKKHDTRVYVATDNMDTFNRWTMPALNISKVFDGVLNSYDLKSRKKDFDKSRSLFFGEFLKKNKIKKGEAVIFDDAEDSENKLQKFGIDYVQIKPGGLVSNLERLFN